MLTACLAYFAAAEVPELMSFQGMLSDSNNTPLTGTYSVQFSIYNSETDGSHIWSETQSVDVNDGLFSVLLGAVNPVTADVFSKGTSLRYLGIKIGSDDEMTPRQRIASVGYAFAAENLGPGVVNVDPNGDVGIGTSSPGIVDGAEQYLTVTTGGGDTASLELRGYNGTAGGNVARIDFIQGAMTIPATNTNIARIEARKDFATGGGRLAFRTRNGSELKTPVTIDYQGHVVIVADESPSVWLKPTPTLLVLGAANEDCFRVRPAEGEGGLVVKSDGRVGIGTMGPTTDLEVNGVTRTTELQISGGADIAEPFDIGEGEVPPGSVVAIDPENPGKLKVSGKAYDRCVAGIVSGAGGVRPGLTMMQQNVLFGSHPVALSGRVFALCDAGYDAIEPGDLLTTSGTAGHAMKVSDHDRARGAVIGKAMSRLGKGRGLVLVLVSLQ